MMMYNFTAIRGKKQTPEIFSRSCKRKKQKNNSTIKMKNKIEPPHDRTNNFACAPNEDSDQPGHPPSLIRVVAVRSVGSKGPKLSSCGQRKTPIRLGGCPG